MFLQGQYQPPQCFGIFKYKHDDGGVNHDCDDGNDDDDEKFCISCVCRVVAGEAAADDDGAAMIMGIS